MQLDTNPYEAHMSSTSPIPRPALFVIAIFALLTLWVILQVEIPMLLGLNADWDRKINDYRWLLHLHAAAGMAALLIGPIQFLAYVRIEHQRWHRRLGYVNAMAIVVAAPLAIWIAVHHLPAGDRLPTIVQSVLWLLCTGAGVLAAVQRRVDAHRSWVYRSYALTTTFVFTRLLFDVAHWQPPEGLGGHGGVLWMATLLALVAAELLASKVPFARTVAANP